MKTIALRLPFVPAALAAAVAADPGPSVFFDGDAPRARPPLRSGAASDAGPTNLNFTVLRVTQDPN